MTLDEAKKKMKAMVPAFAAKVAPIFKLLDWQWEPGGLPPSIPDVAAIEDCLNDCIDALDKNCNFCGRGGLEAFCEPPEKGNSGNYGLSFHYSDMKFFDYWKEK